MRTDIRTLGVDVYLVDTICRTPLKFGAVVVDRLPIAYARARVENRDGSIAEGWGATCELTDVYASAVAGYGQYAHPIELFHETEPGLERLSKDICSRLASRIHTIMGVEANSRQFFPEANRIESKVHEGLYEIRDGYARTSSLSDRGLGMRIEEMEGLVGRLEEEDAGFRRSAARAAAE